MPDRGVGEDRQTANEVDAGVLESLIYDEHSARFWSTHLGQWAAKMRNRADGYAIGAAGISALTGATAWATLADSAGIWPQVVVTAMAVAAAVVAVIPKFRGYTECATKSAKLASEYGRRLDSLRFARAHLEAGKRGADKEARLAIEEFQKTREEKQSLSPFPVTLANEIEEDRRHIGMAKPRMAQPPV